MAIQSKWLARRNILTTALIILSRTAIASQWSHEIFSSSSLKDTLQYIDLPPTVFAPNGRLYSVEATVRACDDESDTSSTTAIAIRCHEGVVVVTTLPKSIYVFDPTDNPPEESPPGFLRKESLLLNDDEDDKSIIIRAPFTGVLLPSSFSTDETVVLGVTGGNAVDSQIARRKLQQIGDQARASEIISHVTAGSVARRLADQQQILTQQGGRGRMLASMMLLLSPSDIWRVDPTGQYWQCQASTIGRQSRKIEKILMEKLLLQMKRRGSEKRGFWSSLWHASSKASTNSEGNQWTESPSVVQNSLEQLTIEEALLLALSCFTDLFSQSSTNHDSNNIPRLCAVSLHRSLKGKAPPIQFYSQEAVNNLFNLKS